MDNIKWLNALGIMSGASLDGAEFSLVKTDGIDVYAVYKSQKFLYPEELKQSIINAANNLNEENSKNADEQFTDFIIKSFDDFISICDALSGVFCKIVRHCMDPGSVIVGNKPDGKITILSCKSCFYQ